MWKLFLYAMQQAVYWLALHRSLLPLECSVAAGWGVNTFSLVSAQGKTTLVKVVLLQCCDICRKASAVELPLACMPTTRWTAVSLVHLLMCRCRAFLVLSIHLRVALICMRKDVLVCSSTGRPRWEPST